MKDTTKTILAAPKLYYYDELWVNWDPYTFRWVLNNGELYSILSAGDAAYKARAEIYQTYCHKYVP